MNDLCKKINELIRKNKVCLVIILLAIIVLILWRMDPNGGTLSDFGLNAFTELLGILVTIMVVENIIEKQNKKNMLPAKAAMYRDIQVFLSRVISFWGEVYHNSVPGENIENVNELFSEEVFEKMSINLNLNSFPQVSPSTEWYRYFNTQGNELYERGEKILNRYYSNMEPEVFRYIHFLVDDSTFIIAMKYILNIWCYDRQNEIPRPQCLAAYYCDPGKDVFDTVVKLFNWCEKTYDELTRKGYSVHRVEVSYVNKKNIDSPQCMLTDEQISFQTKQFSDWQDQHSNVVQQ